MFKKLAATALVIGSALFASPAVATPCSSYSYNITNGSPADGDQVMFDLEDIRTCANTYLAPLAGPLFTGSVGINTAAPQTKLQIATSYARTDTSFRDAFFITSNEPAASNPLVMYMGLVGGATATTRSGVIGVGDLNASNTGNLLLNPYGGSVGIGTTTPSYLLTVNGTAYASGAAGALSDRRHKTDIKAFSDSAIALVMQLKPVTFLWREPKDDGMRGRQIGFIAQDVLPVLPDAVLTMHNTERTLGLKYDSFIPIFAKAIQEQQAQIEALTSATRAQADVIRRLQTQVSALMRKRGQMARN